MTNQSDNDDRTAEGSVRPETTPEHWPPLPFAPWQATCETLHLWTQIVGKIALRQRSWVNHSWHVTFRLTARGIGTGPMPYGGRAFQVDFDFIEHR